MKTRFEKWLDKVNEERKVYWDKNFSYKEYTPLRYEKGSKYVRIWDGTTCWGFVSMKTGENKGVEVREGDLLKPASWKSPAKHSRGNIFEGTDTWNYYGPNYLNQNG
jgi:hypothetical protein